jgi:hypothetical protein
MAEEEGKQDEEKFDFTLEWEVLGYIQTLDVGPPDLREQGQSLRWKDS